MVEDQPPEGHRAHGAGRDEACGAAGGRAGQGRRAVGRRLRRAEHRHGTGRPAPGVEKNEVAREFFATLDRRNRYAILYQIQDAKKPETRARRIQKYVAMLNERKKIYP